MCNTVCSILYYIIYVYYVCTTYLEKVIVAVPFQVARMSDIVVESPEILNLHIHI